MTGKKIETIFEWAKMRHHRNRNIVLTEYKNGKAKSPKIVNS